MPLRQRPRKAIGTALTVLSVILWSAVGLWIYEALLIGASPLLHLVFFVGFGLAWVLPAMAIIRWMARPDP